MVTLANLNGASLVPDLKPGFNQILKSFGTAREREREDLERSLIEEAQLQKARDRIIQGKQRQDVQDSLDLIDSEEPEDQKRGLARIAAMVGAPEAKVIQTSIEQSNKEKLLADQKTAEKAFKDAVFLDSIKDPAKRVAGIRELLSQETDIQKRDELIKLGKLSPEMMDLKIKKQMIVSQDIDSLHKQQLKKLELAEKQGQFEVILDDKGQPLAQRDRVSGKIIADPRAAKIEGKTSLQRNLEAAGVDLNSKEGQALMVEAITKPSTKIDINQANQGLFKTPEGFMLKDRTNPTLGVVPIPGGPKDVVGGEKAAKLQMIRTAKKAFDGTPDSPGVRSLVFDNKGEIERATLLQAFAGIPGTDGARLRSKMEFGIQAITRGETGAAMPPEEVENTRKRFMPRPTDTDDIVKLKLDLFQDFLEGNIKLIDPQGRFNEVRFQTELDKRTEELNGRKTVDSSQTQTKGKQIGPGRFKFNPKTRKLEPE